MLKADSYDSLAGDDVEVSRWFIDVRFKVLVFTGNKSV
jgi:hypothetical protein